MMPRKKGKGLTIGILLGKGPKEGEKSPFDEDTSEEDSEDTSEDEESEEEDELPPGLVEAVTEFRTSESDEDAAKAFHRAIQLCQEY